MERWFPVLSVAVRGECPAASVVMHLLGVLLAYMRGVALLHLRPGTFSVLKSITALAGWLSWLDSSLGTLRLQVRCPVRAHIKMHQ